MSCATLLLGLVPPAFASSNWVIFDLGTSRTEQICLDAAEEAMVAYARSLGMRKVVVGDWVVYGWEMSREPHNAIITCNYAGYKTHAMLVVHTEDRERARVLSLGLIDRFTSLNVALEDAWLAEALRRNGF